MISGKILKKYRLLRYAANKPTQIEENCRKQMEKSWILSNLKRNLNQSCIRKSSIFIIETALPGKPGQEIKEDENEFTDTSLSTI